jgi:hypothetical protein
MLILPTTTQKAVGTIHDVRPAADILRGMTDEAIRLLNNSKRMVKPLTMAPDTPPPFFKKSSLAGPDTLLQSAENKVWEARRPRRPRERYNEALGRPRERYSDAVIYKIHSLDPAITDFYVGSSTNMTKRRYEHKKRSLQTSDSSAERGHNALLYKHIRANGGWEGWDMVLVEHYPCDNRTALEIRERHWIETLGATLNKNKPAGSAVASGQSGYSKHITHRARQHSRETRERAKVRARERVECECGVMVPRCNYARHCRSAKHIAAVANDGNSPRQPS